MILKSFGCSFIFGTDLADNGQNSLYAKASQLTWPALIAQRLNYNYSCYARPGIGNLRILEKIITESKDASQQFFMINWSWIDRYDYVRSNDDSWSTIMPMDSDSTAEFYYKNLNSQYKDKLVSLLYIKQAIDVLQSQSIPFVMTYMDNLIFESHWHSSSAVQYLQDSVKEHMTTFDGKNFLDWSHDRGHPISDSKHPLESAHRDAADFLLNTCSSLNTL